MAAFALTDVDIYHGAVDVSCFANAVAVQPSAAELDRTTFCSGGWTELVAGLKGVTMAASGPQDLTPATGTLVSTAGSWSNGLASLTITGHGLSTGRTVTLSGYTASGWNGTWRVFDAPDANTVRLEMAANPGSLTVHGTVSTYASLDEVLMSDLGVERPFSAVPTGAVEGAAAYFTIGAMALGYTPLEGAVGELGKWSGQWRSRYPLVRGVLASSAVVTATGTGTVHQLGAVGAAQRIWCAAHVLSAAGTTPSVTVAVQSDDNSGMTTPTTRATLSAITTRGSATASAVGAITDTYWRASWTVSGTGPVFGLRVLLGIQ